MQGDVDHIAVGVELRHFHPVADADDVVGGDLHAGHQRQQGVLEDQHQHRCHGAEAREEDQRRAIDQAGDHEDGGDGEDGDLQHLQIALDGPQVGVLAALVEAVDDVQHGAQGQGDGEDDEGGADVGHHFHQGARHVGDHLHAPGQHQRRDDIGQALDQAVVLDLPGTAVDDGACRVEQATDQDAPDQPVGQPGEQDEGGGGDYGVQLVVLPQPCQPGGDFALHWAAPCIDPVMGGGPRNRRTIANRLHLPQSRL
ncbi:hypothetical protein D3C72_1545430 [compost metagenome]